MSDIVTDWPEALGCTSRYVSATDGTRLRVVVGGDPRARPVVLLHGAPQFSFMWRHVVPELLAGSRYRVIVPDLRGYGASDLASTGRYDLDTLVSDLRVVLDHTAEGVPVLLVAHDWGGPIAWRFAESSPDSVRHLLAVNAPHPAAFARELGRPSQAVRSWYIGLFQIPKVDAVIAATGARLFLWMMRASAPDVVFPPAALDVYRAALDRPGRARAVLAYYRQAAGGLDVLGRRREALEGPDTVVPVTVLWGDADLALAPTHPDAVRQHARRLEVRRLPGVSHWVAEERPLEVVRALVEGDTGSAVPLG